MKRFIQIVALVVAALLMAQPALANASCSQQKCSGDHSSSKCCLHADDMPMAGMSRVGAMASMSATCQSLGQPAQFKAINLRETTSVVLLAEFVPIGAGSLPIRAARSSGAAVTPTSAKYILFQTLRI